MREEELQHEASIVWSEGIEQFDYVRESLVHANTRTGRVKAPNGRAVGYGVLASGAPRDPVTRMFKRRVFWLKDYDRGEPNADGYTSDNAPMEAVDPRTVKPGVYGRITERVRVPR